MLILERRLNETVYLDGPGGQIAVQVVGFRRGGTSVKLGITAPSEVNIRREEVPPETRPAGPSDPLFAKRYKCVPCGSSFDDKSDCVTHFRQEHQMGADL